MKPAELSRRHVLAATAAAGSAAALAGCEDVISSVTQRLGEAVPASIDAPHAQAVDPDHHLLSRAAYGPWPGDLEHVRAVGQRAWIEEQLSPDSIDDTACDLRARRFETIHQDPGTCFEYDKPVLRDEMARHTLLRAVYSRRQLFEVMVAFWTDHLNINIDKGDCIYLKPSDDRTVIRAHALGRFRDLIRASATSPAMLVYLDGNRNQRAKPEDVPNENYARELMELHTLGVHGGYTQTDVYELARALTGWRVREKWRRGTVYFDPALHDDGAKKVLGHDIPAGGGEGDVDAAVDIVCRHPSTARYIATKLARRFVCDEPPAPLVDRVAEVFTRSDGDIRQMVRTILTSPEFVASAGQKYKPPFRFVVSSLRAVAADTHAHTPLVEYLSRMGQGIFQHPTPDGYPDEAAAWVGPLLWRWTFALNLVTGQVPAVQSPLTELLLALANKSVATADAVFAYLCGRIPTRDEAAALAEASQAIGSQDLATEPVIGLILASAAFQRY
jgi:hypothetical protein